MRVISLNLNGIRSATRKGFLDWLPSQNADVVCLQELKAQHADLDDALRSPGGLHGYFHCAEKKGYSGVGIYSRQRPDKVIEGLGIADVDREGRYLQADFGALSVISLYLPSGSSSEERQQIKFAFMALFMPHLLRLHACGQEVLLCGDWNIAHQPIDLKNWKGNLKNSGFLPEERAWLSEVFGLGWVDVWRSLYPEAPGYTWWSNRGAAYAKDVGWRIDYQIATPALAASARHASVFKDIRFSDHAPLIVDYAQACNATI